MPEKVSGIQRKDQGFYALRGFQEGQPVVCTLPGTEEIIGLGLYGKTLTILFTEVFADDEDENEDLEERWKVRFRR